MLITDLPTEIQTYILGSLVYDPPSVTKFADEPTVDLTTSDQTPLKNSSLVCKRWRAIIEPWLFATSRIRLHPAKDVYPGGLNHSGSLPDRIDLYLQVSGSLRLQQRVKSLVLIVPDGFEHAFLRHGVDDLKRTRVGGKIHPPHVQDNLAGVWTRIFGSLPSLQCLVVVAKPEIMARLVDVNAPMADAWAFNMPLHYLRLSTVLPKDILVHPGHQTNDQIVNMVNKSHDGWTLDVKNVKPWSHVGYSEGSYLPGYAVYEWQDKQPPNVLREILLSYTAGGQARNQERKAWDTGLQQRPPQDCTALQLSPIIITSMEHIALFPYALDIFDTWKPQFDPDPEPPEPIPENNSITHRERHRIPIRDLTIKYANTDHVADPRKLGKADATDVWHEWYGSWRYIVSRVLPGLSVGSILRIKDSGLAKLQHMVYADYPKGPGGPDEFRRCWRMDYESPDLMIWIKMEDERVEIDEFEQE